MTNAERLRNDFLLRLDHALDQVPHGVAREIRDGVAEELEGLDATTTAARIAQLGDPAEIARAAQESVTPNAAPIVVTTVKPPANQTRGFAILAGLGIGFGGFLLPFVGWFVGAVLVVLSTLWYRWEKIVAILLPFVAAVIVSAVMVVISMSIPNSENIPLVPTGYDMTWGGLFFIAVIVTPLTGLWLLWRLRGRTTA